MDDKNIFSVNEEFKKMKRPKPVGSRASTESFVTIYQRTKTLIFSRHLVRNSEFSDGDHIGMGPFQSIDGEFLAMWIKPADQTGCEIRKHRNNPLKGNSAGLVMSIKEFYGLDTKDTFRVYVDTDEPIKIKIPDGRVVKAYKLYLKNDEDTDNE